MSTRSRLLAACAAIGVLLTAACGDGAESEPGETALSEAPPAAAQAEPASLEDIFPEGLGRSLVIDSCGGCHAVACSAIGQRTEARWRALEADHRDRASDMSDDEYSALFQYLRANFDSTRPEPKVPPQFLEGGCTPF